MSPLEYLKYLKRVQIRLQIYSQMSYDLSSFAKDQIIWDTISMFISTSNTLTVAQNLHIFFRRNTGDKVSTQQNKHVLKQLLFLIF